MRGLAHQDTTVFPEAVREQMDRKCAFYLDISRDPQGELHYEVTQNAGVISGQHCPEPRPSALMTFNRRASAPIDPDKVVQEVCISRSHPVLGAQNLVLAQLIPLIQGRRGVYYCSNYSTCGNGHDLSLLSGFICAAAIGAEYPFPDDARAKLDYERLADAMGLAKQPSSTTDLTKLAALLCGLSAVSSHKVGLS